jgi:hypothetical protein
MSYVSIWHSDRTVSQEYSMILFGCTSRYLNEINKEQTLARDLAVCSGRYTPYNAPLSSLEISVKAPNMQKTRPDEI